MKKIVLLIYALSNVGNLVAEEGTEKNLKLVEPPSVEPKFIVQNNIETPSSPLFGVLQTVAVIPAVAVGWETSKTREHRRVQSETSLDLIIKHQNK